MLVIIVGNKMSSVLSRTNAVGRNNVSLENTTLADLEMKHTELHLGGRWFPTSCTARQKIAIIVPFHDRQSHLTVLMNNLHSTLQRQQVDYTIFVVEQVRTMINNYTIVRFVCLDIFGNLLR